ncbi:MAG: type II CRISPR RNA-guided endonuclease Cas9 [Bacteroidaceae bacterium]
MVEKHILGLDLGTNSIGWAVVKETYADDGKQISKTIVDAGSRILPMDAAMQSDFARGNSISQTAERTRLRMIRRINERMLLRRERLHRVLRLLGFLPAHYASSLDRYGKHTSAEVPLLPWTKDEDGHPHFLFKESYDEMLQLFYQHQPDLMQQGMKVPYDWTIYYLRHKALTQPVSGQELAWILLQFNQKRGYYQTRADQQETDKTKEEAYYALKVVDVVDSGDRRGKEIWWNVMLENGMVYRRTAREKPDWTGKVKEFIVTTQLNDDGTPKVDKEGNIRRSFRMPGEDDWGLIKVKTQADIRQSSLTVGSYIFQALLRNPKQKIIGKLVRTIERDFYKQELRQILRKQQEFLPELTDRELYAACVHALYPQNEAYRNSIASRDFTYLLIEDVLFYQRPLKSKKSLIGECPYESHRYTNEQGEQAKAPIKCIAKSHPLYQEFRLWQFVGNLRIYQSQVDANGRSMDDADVTSRFLPDEAARVALFDYLNNLPRISQRDLLVGYFHLKCSKAVNAPGVYRWNYVEDRQYPCNTTRGDIISRLKKAGVRTDFLNETDGENQGNEPLLRLWHILYSVDNPVQLKDAMKKYARRYDLDDRFVDVMSKFPPFENEYGAYSAKAIKRLLPLMRMGRYWRADAIDAATRQRIRHILDGEVDERISTRVREKAISLTSEEQFRGLPLWLACYVVYNRHSETSDIQKWESPADIDAYLAAFRQHSLRNPVVEQVVTETLRTVRDIWRSHGSIDEIHLELGREIKNPADKRAKITQRALDNEIANLRVKALLTEFMNPEFQIENVRPFSPSQQELLRIYEDTALNSVEELDDDIADILKKFAQTEVSKRPTRSEVMRYKLWLEQHYVSPYTGQPIPLSRLFTSDYEIEHVIPQSLYFDDSLSNKVICEAEVNKLKDNALGYAFICQHHGEKVQISGGRTVKVLEVDSYCDLVNRLYRRNPSKAKKLLMEDIPAEFIERQLNDSRYISKFVKALLSHIVREDDEQEATSKNLIVCSGSVTDRLKKDWGINEVWNHLVLPRFQRMNELTESHRFTTTNSHGHLIPDMPLELQKGFNKKRIDHRHHAMDAIVIACTTREHVNLISNEAASPKNNQNRYQLSRKLRRYEEVEMKRDGEVQRRMVAKEFLMPWPGFPADVERALNEIVVSFKQNLRVINKTKNYSIRFVNGKKKEVAQTKGDSWAIRKSMHKDTVFGEVNLRREKTVSLKEAMKQPQRIVDKELKEKIKTMLALNYSEKDIKNYFTTHAESWSDVNLKKIKVYYFTQETSDRFFATRKSIDTSFDEKTIREKLTDTGIQQIMLRHLSQCGGNAEVAFSPDGIDRMNQHLRELNNGRDHQPIYKVRVYEKAEKFAVGQKGNKSKKFVEGAKGTNLFFAVYEKDGRRSYRTIPFYEAVDKMKQGLPVDEDALFILSPNDLVYLPTAEELAQGKVNLPLDKSRVYKLVSCGQVKASFVHHAVSSIIQDKVEFSSQNKMERAITGEMIKETCLPLKVDRLGHIVKIGV